MLMTMPCTGVPVITPRRPVALVRANVAADRTASTAPKACTGLLLGKLLAHGAALLERPAWALLRADPNGPFGVPVKVWQPSAATRRHHTACE
jgi:hypothetical protein